MATCWAHCPSSRPVQHHVEGSCLSLWFLQWEKKTHRATGRPHPQHCGCFGGVPTLISHHRGFWGNLWGLTTGNLTVTGKGERAATISAQILAAWVHACSGQAVVPTNLIPEGQMLSTLLWIEAEKYSFYVSKCLLSAANGSREERKLNSPKLGQF